MVVNIVFFSVFPVVEPLEWASCQSQCKQVNGRKLGYRHVVCVFTSTSSVFFHVSRRRVQHVLIWGLWGGRPLFTRQSVQASTSEQTQRRAERRRSLLFHAANYSRAVHSCTSSTSLQVALPFSSRADFGGGDLSEFKLGEQQSIEQSEVIQSW